MSIHQAKVNRKINAMIYEMPRQGQLTQGTIFSCAYAENYQDAGVYGIIITARCDVAQSKVPIFSYVPVVPIKEWILRDGYEIILKNSIDDCENTLNTIIDTQNISKILINTFGYKKIYDTNFHPREKERGFESIHNKYKRALDEWLLSKEQTSSPPPPKDRELILKKHPKKIERIAKDLAENKILGHYLLTNMKDLNGNYCDHVVLLREIHHISRELSVQIIDGIAKENYKPIAGNLCPKFTDSEDLSAPVIRLKSPWIEHLMQSLTLLFSRIGVDDIDHNSVKKSLSHLTEA